MKMTLLLAAAVLLAGGIPGLQAQDAPATGPTTAQAVAEAIDEIGAVPPPQVPLPPGMRPIFDGKTLDGWAQIPPDSWVARKSVLASLGTARGVIHTRRSLGRYRVIFDVRHVAGIPKKSDHRAGVLVFCTPPEQEEKPSTTLGGIQFQVPNGGHWDYRAGKNNSGKGLFTRVVNPKFDEKQWSRVEILVDPASGTARMAVAQPVGSKAVEVLTFTDPSAGRDGPFALQMHNKGLFDEYANLAVEESPSSDELITTK